MRGKRRFCKINSQHGHPRKTVYICRKSSGNSVETPQKRPFSATEAPLHRRGIAVALQRGPTRKATGPSLQTNGALPAGPFLHKYTATKKAAATHRYAPPLPSARRHTPVWQPRYSHRYMQSRRARPGERLPGLVFP